MAVIVLKKEDLPLGVVEATRDPRGRTVRLSESAMRHIRRRHPELDGCELAITTAVENAAFRCGGNKPGREVLYAANLGPARWMAVVVAYGETGGEVITAHASNRGPRDGEVI